MFSGFAPETSDRLASCPPAGLLGMRRLRWRTSSLQMVSVKTTCPGGTGEMDKGPCTAWGEGCGCLRAGRPGMFPGARGGSPGPLPHVTPHLH